MPTENLSATPSDLKASLKVARRIVANLLLRKRFARRMLMKAGAEDTPDAIMNSLYATYSEAHNAAESSRRILYHGPHAL